jgi:hypothetical protein
VVQAMDITGSVVCTQSALPCPAKGRRQIPLCQPHLDPSVVQPQVVVRLLPKAQRELLCLLKGLLYA